MTDGRNPGMSTDELLVRGIVCAKLPQTACMKSPQCKLRREEASDGTLRQPPRLPAALSQQLLRALLVFMRAQTDVPRCKIAAAVSRPPGMGLIGSANGVDRE